MIWNPYSPPEGTHIAPCPDCGGNLDPRVSEDEDGQWWDIDCAGTVDRDGCGWCAYEVEDLAPFTLAGAPWTRGVWAEVERTRGERDAFLAQVHALSDAGNAAAVIMSAASERIAGLLKERDALAARVRELEAPGECQSSHVAICPDCGEVETCDEERCCLSCGRDLLVFADRYSAELYRDREMQEHADHLATLHMRIAEVNEALCSDADEATLRRAVSSLVYEARGHGGTP